MGFPLELLTMLGSGLLSGVMTLWGMNLKAKAAQQEYMLKAMAIRHKAIDRARQVQTPAFSFTRRSIAIMAVFSIIVLPKLAALWGLPPVTVGYTEFNPGFWFFTSDHEVLQWKTAVGFVITPLDTHIVSAVCGLYFGSSIVKNS
jgi:hypothetical protein